RLSERMTKYVVWSTWKFLAPYNQQVFERMLVDRAMFPLSRLYQHLFKSTRTEIDVVTTNYDLLAEFAADSADINHFTGFGYGHLRLRADPNARIYLGKNLVKRINVWKVH